MRPLAASLVWPTSLMLQIGHPPSKITVVGYEMKRQRFVSLHRKALRWPEDRFTYVGVGLDPKDDPEAWEGEVSSTFSPYPPARPLPARRTNPSISEGERAPAVRA